MLKHSEVAGGGGTTSILIPPSSPSSVVPSGGAAAAISVGSSATNNNNGIHHSNHEVTELQRKADAIRKHTSNDSECFICLEDLSAEEGSSPVIEQLPCGHLGHSECLSELVVRKGNEQHQQQQNANLLHQQPTFNCPVCRQSVELFCPSFRHGDKKMQQQQMPEPLRRFNGELSSLGINTSARGSWSLLSYSLRNFTYLPLGLKIVIFVALGVAIGYLFWPSDLLSEKKWGPLGLFDDAVVLWLCVFVISIALRRALSLMSS